MEFCMPDFKIEKNVPIPITSTIPALPLIELGIGHSFVIEAALGNQRNTIRLRLYRFQKRNPPIRLSMRSIDDAHVRIQRVDDRV